MASTSIRILGIDPGLRNMGWGIIDFAGTRLSYVASGSIHSSSRDDLGARLRVLHEGLTRVIDTHGPHEAAVEETFVNRDPQSALKLGQARGIALVVPAIAGLRVTEYAANLIKKTVTGTGHAEKAQVALMVKVLLPKCAAFDNALLSADAADALAIAITHAHHYKTTTVRRA
jgi:crossover junction endodeoxyribonuclease RuvC